VQMGSQVWKPLDVVIWGATGFTGQLIVRYFATTVKDHRPDVKWALAGRDEKKLDDVKRKYVTPGAWDPPVLVGNIADQESVDAIVGSTHVVIAAAGPFTNYGTPIVDACVRFETDYCDITGEVPWVKQIIDKYHAQAQRAGVTIVPMCGFDSIPSDIGTLWTVTRIENELKQPTNRVMNYALLTGMSSGGTIASGIIMESKFPNEMKNVFLLGGAPNDGPTASDQDLVDAVFDKTIGSWVAPFGMAKLNTRVVRRSNFLQGNQSYGRSSFSYNEQVLSPNEKFAKKMAHNAAIPAHVLESLVAKGKLPKPGEGPPPESRETHFFRMVFVGEAADGQTLVSSISGGDAGYDETSKFVSESALVLLDVKKKKLSLKPAGSERKIKRGGVLTPAAAFGLHIKQRLQERGIAFETHASPKEAVQIAWAAASQKSKL